MKWNRGGFSMTCERLIKLNCKIYLAGDVL
mgnify:CR=1 FL=1